MKTCRECGGTILPRSRSGALRGTCHCYKGPGGIRGRSFHQTEGVSLRYEYDVVWDGKTVGTFPSMVEAETLLESMRVKWRQKQKSRFADWDETTVVEERSK